MQGKGIIVTFTVLLALICLYELLPTVYVQVEENKACKLSDGTEASYQKEIDNLKNDTLNILGLKKLSYTEAKSRQMNLGLDLKGGMNVMLQVSEKDLLQNLSNKSKNEVFLKALKAADEAELNSSKAYVDNFFEAFKRIKKETNSTTSLSSFDVFGNNDLVKPNSSDEEVEKIIKDKVDASVEQAVEVFRTRIDKLGVAQPNINKVNNTGRILIELPGVTEKERVKKMLQTSAKLEFWKVSKAGVLEYFSEINNKQNNIVNLININKVSSGNLYAGGALAAAKISDTAKVNTILKSAEAKGKLTGNLKYAKFVWSVKPEKESPDYLGLFVLEGNARDEHLLENHGGVNEASIEYDQMQKMYIQMKMDLEGAKKWGEVTSKNIGQNIAIVLDNAVYSAPVVQSAITEGNSQISGHFTKDEAKDLVNVLKTGKLPAKARIIQSDEVGPSLGAESIQSGLISSIVAYLVILVWMIFYYKRAGWYADIALFLNMFFIIGVSAAFGTVITLPGIAGLILTMGMAVDANIITFERVKDELRRGYSLKEAVNLGSKHALAAILDGNITTLITAVILFFFGSGPIKGFATTLIIGIIFTLFTALLITRVLMDKRLEEGKSISFWTNITEHWFQNVNFNWMDKRKYAYTFSIILMVASIISLSTKGLNLGVDYQGGRTYNIKLEKPFESANLSQKLTSLFVDEKGNPVHAEVKTIGTDNRVKITTKYKVNDVNPKVDDEIQEKLYQGLKEYLPAGFTYNDFLKGEKYGKESSSRVDKTVSDDIQERGYWAVFGALLGIFIYILIRFIRWQFSLGAVVALFHDSLITLGIFSVGYGIIPISLEIDQGFVAAILTVIGYSINDTVIVFDRIRENMKLHPTLPFKQIIDDSINQTLGRTLNTVATVMFVIIVILIFGGDSLRSFMFALFVGIGFGTFSSIYVASALAYDLYQKKSITESKR